jgi:hypothetical protein
MLRSGLSGDLRKVVEGELYGRSLWHGNLGSFSSTFARILRFCFPHQPTHQSRKLKLMLVSSVAFLGSSGSLRFSVSVCCASRGIVAMRKREIEPRILYIEYLPVSAISTQS